VSRLRWALVKFGLVGGGVVVAAACYALLVTWWRAPIDQTTGNGTGRFAYGLFDLEGLVPIGYALFAVALGVLAGTLTRRTQTAMAITLVGFLATRLTVEFLVRAHYLPPVRRTFPLVGTMAPNQLTGDWVVSAGIYSAQGTRLSGGTFGSFSQTVCPLPTTVSPSAAPATADPCLEGFAADAYNLQLFHPADRFWLFQGIETALFVASAALLLLAAVHVIRRRISWRPPRPGLARRERLWAPGVTCPGGWWPT
jgi:hypothetical protein